MEDRSLYTYSQESVNHPTFSSVLEIDNVFRGTYRISAVAYKSAPLMMTYFEHKSLPILLDTGAENNIISSSIVKKLNIKIFETPSKASQVDKSLLKSIGRIVIPISNGEETWKYDALVCDNVGDVIIGGNPLLDQGINPVTYRNEIDIVTSDGSIRKLPWRPPNSHQPFKPRVGILRCDESVTLYQGDFIDLRAPPEFKSIGDAEVLVRPRSTSDVYSVNVTATKYTIDLFPPPEYKWMIQGRIRLVNKSSFPIIIPKHKHIADISLVTSGANIFPILHHPINFSGQAVPISPHYLENFHRNMSRNSLQKQLPDPNLYPRPKPVAPVCQADQVCIDPDNILDYTSRDIFSEITKKYAQVFSSKPGLYNGALGNLDAHLVLNDNVEPPSFPSRKIVQSEKLDRIKQSIMDEMEADGILVRPEDHGIHDSYLVPKTEDGVATGEYRLVTNLQSLSPYIKPTRIPLPTIEESFRKLGQWTFIVLMDLRSWHWQIPLDRKAMRFMGTSTPFAGDRVYAVQPQGYLNATENSDRVIQAVLEPVMRQGKCLRVADNLITGGNSPAEAAKNYELILKLCDHCGLTFKAKKTLICPKQTTILGKVWNQGKLSPSIHLMSTIASASFPSTVKQMRSFTGSVKQMKDNIKDYHLLLHPLEKVVAGKKSAERITWTDALRDAFKKTQKVAGDPDILVLPKPSEKLIIFPDWSDEHQAGGAPLYVKRDSKLLKVRNFGQRLRAMKRWSPCEGEAWIIRTGVENHSPWIEESSVSTEVATDNYPCVLAFKRLRRGLFSKSVRVAYFLSTLGSYRVNLVHKPGLNHPGDYDSRNCLSCNLGKHCQVCTFAFDLAGPTAQEVAHPANVSIPERAVLHISINDVLNGPAIIPYTQRQGWLDIQQENQILKKLRMHMQGGTIPVRKVKGENELKSLYTLFLHQKITIAKDNMIVRVEVDKSGDKKETIVVPAAIMKGLIMALHYRFSHPHPSTKELITLCNRYWFSIGTARLIEEIKQNCQLCRAIAPVPREFFEQSTSRSGKLGSLWAADVIRGDLQFVFIAREKLSCYTVTSIIPNERHETLREAIIVATAELIPEDGLTVQVDNASGLVKLVGDSQLERHKIKIETGRKNNKDSNQVAEKAVKEFREQKLKFKPQGGAISEVERATITSSLNRMLRNRNFSAREIITNRNQNTHEPLNLIDKNLADEQLQLRLANHPFSEKSKVKEGRKATETIVWPGALVFLKKDKTKLRARETYIVVKIEGEFCFIKKLKNKIMSESYKVKLTEVCLLPNQQHEHDADDEEEPEVSADVPNDKDQNATNHEPFEENIVEAPAESGPTGYNTRKKARVDYKKLSEGNFLGKVSGKELKKLKYAWDTPDCSEDDDFIYEPKLQFQIWCENQNRFFPRNSIFLHYFRDKYPATNPASFQALADVVLSRISSSLRPQSTSSTATASESYSSPNSDLDSANSLDGDNYVPDPSCDIQVAAQQLAFFPHRLEDQYLDLGTPLKPRLPSEPNTLPQLLDVDPIVEHEDPNQVNYEHEVLDVPNDVSISPTDEPVESVSFPINPQLSNLILCPIKDFNHSCPYTPMVGYPPPEPPPGAVPSPTPPPHPRTAPILPPPNPSRLRRRPRTDYSSLHEYGKDGKEAWTGT